MSSLRQADQSAPGRAGARGLRAAGTAAAPQAQEAPVAVRRSPARLRRELATVASSIQRAQRHAGAFGYALRGRTTGAITTPAEEQAISALDHLCFAVGGLAELVRDLVELVQDHQPMGEDRVRQEDLPDAVRGDPIA